METRAGQCPLGSQCEDIKDGIKYVCPWYVTVRGTNPQTGEAVDDTQCAIAWMPMLQIETSKESRQTGAAVESFRNRMVEQNQQLLKQSSQLKLIEDK